MSLGIDHQARPSLIFDGEFSIKYGHPFREIPRAPSGLFARLRIELSVTTVEELVGLWRSSKDDPLRAAGDRTELESLAHRALDVLPAEQLKSIVKAEQRSYRYATVISRRQKGAIPLNFRLDSAPHETYKC